MANRYAAKRLVTTAAKQIARATKSAQPVYKQKFKTYNKISQGTRYAKITEGHGDISYSKYTKIRPPKYPMEKKLAAIKGKITRRYINTLKISGQSGRQTAENFTFFELAHLKQMVTDVWNNSSNSDMGLNTGTDNIANQTSTATVNDLAPYISKTQHKLTVTNFENATTTVTIYDLVCKRDTNDTPSACWVTGMQEQNVAQLSPFTYNFHVGESPLQSKVFREKWGVEQISKISLKPGENHQHSVYVVPNLSISNNRVQSETPKNYLAGVSRCVMIVAQGVMATSQATPSTVSTAPVSLGTMWQRQYTYAANLRKHKTTYAPLTPLTVIADPKIIQEDGDAQPVTSV
jgi:hypothetical protein